MPTNEHPSNDQFEQDLAELTQLEGMLTRLSDEPKIADAARFRLRMFAAIRALRDLVDAATIHPVGASRTVLVAQLNKWRTTRAIIAARLGDDPALAGKAVR